MAESMEALSWTDTSDGAGSDYNEELITTASITTSIYQHEKENGRSYHAFHAGKYVMPNDDGEQERMDSQCTWSKKASIAETNVHSSSLPLPAAGAQ
jgi:hypothetical protein